MSNSRRLFGPGFIAAAVLVATAIASAAEPAGGPGGPGGHGLAAR